MSCAFFAVESLTKRFGGLTAVNKISFELKRDQIAGDPRNAACAIANPLNYTPPL
jgi:hypothetical protein